MALQTNLSKKDKLTIAILLFAVAVFMIIWFLIRPAITSILTTNDKIEQAEITQTQNRNKIMLLTSGESLYSKSVSDLNGSTADFYSIMDSSEIDKMVTSYVLKSGLFAENLTIRMPDGSVDEAPYIYSDLSGKKSISAIDTSSASSGNVDSFLTPYNTARSNCNSTVSSGVQRVGLSLVVSGSRKTCQAFIDDICTKPAVRISAYAWDKVDMIEQINEKNGLVEYVDPGTVRLRVDLYLYMTDVADYGSVAPDSAT